MAEPPSSGAGGADELYADDDDYEARVAQAEMAQEGADLAFAPTTALVKKAAANNVFKDAVVPYKRWVLPTASASSDAGLRRNGVFPKESPFFEIPSITEFVALLPHMSIDPTGSKVPSGQGFTHFVAAPKAIPTSFRVSGIARHFPKPKGVGPRGNPPSSLKDGDVVDGSELGDEDVQVCIELSPIEHKNEIAAVEAIYQHFLRRAFIMRSALFRGTNEDITTVEGMGAKFKRPFSNKEGKSFLLYATVRGFSGIFKSIVVEKVGTGLSTLITAKSCQYKSILDSEPLSHPKPTKYAALLKLGKGEPTLTDTVMLRRDGAIESASPTVTDSSGSLVFRHVSPADVVDGTPVHCLIRLAGFHVGAPGIFMKVALDYVEFTPQAPTSRAAKAEIAPSLKASKAVIIAYMAEAAARAAALMDVSPESQTEAVFNAHSVRALEDDSVAAAEAVTTTTAGKRRREVPAEVSNQDPLPVIPEEAEAQHEEPADHDEAFAHAVQAANKAVRGLAHPHGGVSKRR